ncbi:MAG: PD40 domain-containing protein [Planctomycetes bacterium]|nr:PD40 domain-containing protein [Planctomycetota bacterium]MBL7044509.1 PD40 domain-containing protein [Pirellulaceae bacterium]
MSDTKSQDRLVGPACRAGPCEIETLSTEGPARQAGPTTILLLLVGIWSPVAIASDAELLEELKHVPNKIVYETYRENNWELFLVNADGSDPVNLTNTTDVDELYPHASPDGSKICFVADEGQGASRVRNVYYMNVDGSDRKLVASNARQSFWNADGTAIAYLKGESDDFTYSSIATRGLFVYDLASGRHRQHPNKEISHLFGACWSPCGKWFVSTIHGGMGYRHAIVGIEADGTGVFNLGIPGCRPEVSPDGKRIAWTPSDWALRVADLDLTGPQPAVTGGRDVVTSAKPTKVYHIDWPPDAKGKYVVFTRGPATKRLGQAPEGVGVRAEGWNICVADVTATNRWVAITTDGNCNKEPDWVPVAAP